MFKFTITSSANSKCLYCNENIRRNTKKIIIGQNSDLKNVSYHVHCYKQIPSMGFKNNKNDLIKLIEEMSSKTTPIRQFNYYEKLNMNILPIVPGDSRILLQMIHQGIANNHIIEKIWKIENLEEVYSTQPGLLAFYGTSK